MAQSPTLIQIESSYLDPKFKGLSFFRLKPFTSVIVKSDLDLANCHP